ncbi:MAG: oxidoreductase [Ferruginibacter sp.]|nr:oxidoreductase [Ferruginibacter sp.]
MAKILILFAHPALEKSRVHKRLIRPVKQLENVSLHDLYQVYPEMDIDIAYEQKLLLQHDIIIMQHPFYWYSAPAIIKQWQDLVLEHGWAYGSGGTALTDKKIMNAISCGGSKEVYNREGRNRYTITELLVPFEQTAHLCHLQYLPPFVVHGTHKLKDPDIELYAVQYEEMLIGLANDRITAAEWQQVSYMNDLNLIPKILQS